MEQNKNITPEAQEAANDAALTLGAVQGVIVSNNEDYEAAAADLVKVKGKLKELIKKRKEITDPMNAAKAAVVDFFRAPTKFLEDAERVLKRLMIDYTNEQERIQREEQRKRDEAGRLRLAEIEHQRQEHEAAALALAEEAEASGDTEGAAEMLEEAIAPVYVAPSPPPAINTISGHG